uniref:Prolixin antimicrobial peptide n=2 Tax=Arthropoda TaxID=6656 RepID=B8QEI8_RHOPR|nr:prolixicin antimicrobial peptide [Rhodnius prolixus]
MFKTILVLVVALNLLGAFTYASPRPDDKKNQGSASVDVQNERGEGTKVDARVRQELWRSDDGRTRAQAYGHWDRTYGGRNHGERSYGGGMRIEHTWGN